MVSKRRWDMHRRFGRAGAKFIPQAEWQKNGWRPFTEHDYKISDAMATALCNFAKTGNPNESGADLWQPTTAAQKKMMIWGEKLPHMGMPSKLKLIFTMLTNKAVGE